MLTLPVPTVRVVEFFFAGVDQNVVVGHFAEVNFRALHRDFLDRGLRRNVLNQNDGSANQYNKYEGEAGIKLNMLNRVMFAIKEQSMKLLI